MVIWQFWDTTVGLTLSLVLGVDRVDTGQPLLLAEAGLERFHSQAAGIALDIDAFGEDQAIWLGVMALWGIRETNVRFGRLPRAPVGTSYRNLR